jgi:hypothetical protein
MWLSTQIPLGHIKLGYKSILDGRIKLDGKLFCRIARGKWAGVEDYTRNLAISHLVVFSISAKSNELNTRGKR